jgi:hypothetical protein
VNEYARLHRLIASDAAGPGVRRWAGEYLSGITSGRVEVAAVRHPLGFWCFPAWRGADGGGVCVHVWLAGVCGRPTTSPIHAHSWDLLSMVLYGTVGNDVVVIDRAAVPPSHRIFEIYSSADGDLVRATRRMVGCRIHARQHFRAGEVYTLPNGTFHVSDVQGDAATVVLGRSGYGGPDQSLGAPGLTDHRVCRTRCGAAETRRIATAALARLSKAGLSEQLEDRWEPAT